MVALVTYDPPSVQRPNTAPDQVAELPAPTVEALISARTAKRGGHLRRGGKVLAGGEALSVGDVLRAGEKPGCLVLEPSTTLCLAPLAAVRLASLTVKGSVVEVLEGRVVATVEGASERFELGAGPVHASAMSGVFGLEHSESDDAFRVRVLDGSVHTSSPFGARDVHKGQIALVRSDLRTFTVDALPDAQAQREWELRSTTLPASAQAR
jgi:hypothetical protein